MWGLRLVQRVLRERPADSMPSAWRATGVTPFVRRWANAVLDAVLKGAGSVYPRSGLTVLILMWIGWWLVITDVARGVLRP